MQPESLASEPIGAIVGLLYFVGAVAVIGTIDYVWRRWGRKHLGPLFDGWLYESRRD